MNKLPDKAEVMLEGFFMVVGYFISALICLFLVKVFVICAEWVWNLI